MKMNAMITYAYRAIVPKNTVSGAVAMSSAAVVKENPATP
jgi:hypothetical protein